MRNLPITILQEMAKQQGTEPLTVVGVQWVDEGVYVLYSEKNFEGIHGKIESIGTINFDMSYQSINHSSVDITVSDTDGLVRGFYDKHDLHKRKCFIWQYFGTLNEKFLLFQGQTNSPITWSESNRNISFTILSDVEDQEVGFSPEQADYDFVSYETIGKAWPLCFGDVLHVPAVKTRQTPIGTLRTKLSIVDQTLFYKLDAIINAYFQQIFIYNYYKSLGGRLESASNNMIQQANVYMNQLRTIVYGTASTPLEVVTVAYCWLIGQEDAYKRGIADLQELITKKKQELAQRKAGTLPWGNTTPKEYREELKLLRQSLSARKKENQNIIKSKKIVEKAIDEVEYLTNVQVEAFQRQTETFNTIVDLHHQYIEILDEICYQRQTERSTLIIENGDHFPQGQSIDLLVNDMRVRGTFNGDIFTIQAILPKYRNVPMGPRQTVLNDCGDPTYDGSLPIFWIKDNSYNLKNNYCLVQDKFDKYHIIYVKEQIDNRCVFDLKQPIDDISGSSGSRREQDLFNSKVDFPVYNTPLANVPKASNYPVYNVPGRGQINGYLNYADYNLYNAGFTDYVNKALLRYGADPLDVDEFQNFLRLKNMVVRDRGADFIFFDPVTPQEMFLLLGQNIKKIVEVAAIPMKSWYKKNIDIAEIPEDQPWSANPNTTVYDMDNPYEIYIANILPSDVRCVEAYRLNEHGERYLDVIPAEYYELNESHNLGDDLIVTSLKFKTPLSSIQGEQWESEVYVSLQSSVGNRTVDQLIYIIETYTDKDWDLNSFGHVYEMLGDKYPSNFALLSQQNVLKLLSDIAWQSRCCICLINETFYLYYLSEEPNFVKELSNKDMETGSIALSYTETESLVTKLTAKWKEDYLPETETKEIVLRNNIQKYGLHKMEYDFYIYNIPELVQKSATFWLIRLSNTWKYVRFKTFIEHLDLEVYDCIHINVDQVPFSKGIIEHISYNLDDKGLEIGMWLPIKAGNLFKYPLAWPSQTDIEFPLSEEEGDQPDKKWRSVKTAASDT